MGDGGWNDMDDIGCSTRTPIIYLRCGVCGCGCVVPPVKFLFISPFPYDLFNMHTRTWLDRASIFFLLKAMVYKRYALSTSWGRPNERKRKEQRGRVGEHWPSTDRQTMRAHRQMTKSFTSSLSLLFPPFAHFCFLYPLLPHLFYSFLLPSFLPPFATHFPSLRLCYRSLPFVIVPFPFPTLLPSDYFPASCSLTDLTQPHTPGPFFYKTRVFLRKESRQRHLLSSLLLLLVIRTITPSFPVPPYPFAFIVHFITLPFVLLAAFSPFSFSPLNTYNTRNNTSYKKGNFRIEKTL